MATPTIVSQGMTVLVTRSTSRSVTQSQWRGSGSVQENLFGEPRVGMEEAMHQRISERRARHEEPVL